MVEYFVHGIHLQVDSDWSRFLQYLDLNLAAFSPPTPTTDDLLVRVAIRRKPWRPRPAGQATRPATEERWGDDLSVDGAAIRFRWGSVSLDFSSGPPATVHATYLLDRKTRLAGALHEVPRWEDVQAVSRFAVYLPLFHLIERSGAIVLHAAAVAGKRSAIVLSGLNGSGKSTLCSALAERLRYMSDNYVIWTGQEILGFPEALRIPLGNAANTDSARPSVWGKRLVPPDPTRISLSAKPGALFLLTLARTTAAKRVAAAEAIRRLEVVQDMTAEFPRYGYLGPLSPSRNPGAIESLANAVPAYALAVGDTSEARERVLELTGERTD